MRHILLTIAVAAGLAVLITPHPSHIPPQAITAETSEIRVVGQLGGDTNAVLVQGNYAYIGVGPRLVILNIANPADPIVVGQGDPLPDMVEGIALSGNYAYVAKFSGLHILDVADPSAPVEVGSYDTPYMASDVVVVGDYAYVADGEDGLRVINVADPSAPTEVGAYDTPGNAQGVAAAGNYVYIADGNAGLHVIDVTDPANPTPVGLYDSPGDANDVTLSGSYAYLADGSSGVQIVNISTPSAPNPVGTYSITALNSYAYDLVVAGGIAYVAAGDYAGVCIGDISTPASPTHLGCYNTPGDAKSVALAAGGGHAFVADGDSGLRAVNVTDPANPTEVGKYELFAHFQHDRLFPTDPLSQVFATEVTATTDYQSVLAFSVGCHSGLNVPDDAFPSPQTGTDWAQAFLRQGATFIGNTGYGYGDSDLIAYSERLMADFAQALGHWHGGQPQTVGNALLQAKQNYYNSAAGGGLSTYDEKVIGQATLYGLPMVRISVPNTTTVGGNSLTGQSPAHQAAQVFTTAVNLTFDYVTHTVEGLGTYYALADQTDVHVSGGRPVLPRTGVNVHQDDAVAHGVLWVGGSFTDVTNFDPVVSRVVTDQLYVETEPLYPTETWYPLQMGAINRFLTIGGQSREKLIVVPAQFQASTPASPTSGVQRLYDSLQFQVYHAPFTSTDFIAPSIWQVQALSTTQSLQFRVEVEDDSGMIQRTVVLYRPLTGQSRHTWSRVELAYDAASGWAVGSGPPPASPIEYIVQAVDPAGNVALALDHGQPFRRTTDATLVFLPLVLKQ